MSIEFCIASSLYPVPISYHPTEVEAESALPATHARYPEASVMTTQDYWRQQRAKNLAQFPLTEITEDFYDQMHDVLPPLHIRGCAGFFVSEAVTETVYSQLIEWNGRFFAGYADIAADGRVWTIADVQRIISDPSKSEPIEWFPPVIDLRWRDENYGSIISVAAFRNYAGTSGWSEKAHQRFHECLERAGFVFNETRCSYIASTGIAGERKTTLCRELNMAGFHIAQGDVTDPTT